MEILGLLDHLESVVLDSPKVPFTKKIIADEEKFLQVIDKIRLVIQSPDLAKGTIIVRGEKAARGVEDETESKAMEVMEQAYKMAKEIREGADKYADEVLANLEATSTRILRTVKAGRERLEKTTQAGAAK
ncbi:hypothetical protein A2625_02805 [candidate division WOR-1 bacterium RIFCSPHIGHO2_01_FULL_53_15]|uniref:ATPase n=1 Tax=candidate division WOR-1 bacterium RIFCSPHIGHO2_01_FULL_53_15 TaxID=1802564 RepID=A0A1F4Q2Y1_UNCSA|nr:MAG: hypothetical protein A2625_02805 [candidate division WOR-1 bacterium RIFCSPHIGHO2_01_FULL_53_15]OGC10359.1 MAG: hypothetical protein A3D23_07495 [candidate division WOR-1 bacterium RIFCSPHIGHO2_02_FULL_53_26]